MVNWKDGSWQYAWEHFAPGNTARKGYHNLAVMGLLYIMVLLTSTLTRIHVYRSIVLPHIVKQQYVHFRLIQTTFFYLWNFLEKLADDLCFSITKDSIYHIKHNVHTPFSGLTWNWTLNGSIYYAWFLHILRFYFVWQGSSRSQCVQQPFTVGKTLN